MLYRQSNKRLLYRQSNNSIYQQYTKISEQQFFAITQFIKKYTDFFCEMKRNYLGYQIFFLQSFNINLDIYAVLIFKANIENRKDVFLPYKSINHPVD
ncbi:hypothetical protein G293_05050 [Candidatus Liberibacter africanus PTSAPSY]|uniref:Uncharacterized protein n=1 Tax=Candidatus Liberibacter africanus PTSAPSY TaxID=1277257 RepID=A0A0G3I7U2_LIBAF|nr:hypothetical protein G293_05050 [Candidatus Liberibacter africanus PTSAPSY]